MIRNVAKTVSKVLNNSKTMSESSILVHCPAGDQAAARKVTAELTGQSHDDGNDIPWTIDNKYYTAKVTFRITSYDETIADSPAHLIILPATGLPLPLLDKIRDAEPEMAFALQLKSRDETTDDLADQLQEYAIELIDLTTDRSEALREVNQSLQAYMWPSMVLKPKPELRAPLNAVASSSKLGAERDEDFGEYKAAPNGFAQDEMRRLDAWLDEDNTSGSRPTAESFDDDFEPHGDDLDLPLDPGPLLQRLEATRAQLANVTDEDERRVMAATEVERLFKSLGIDLHLDEEDLLPRT